MGTHAGLDVREKQRSSFLDFPPEIRNQIYEAALIKHGPIDLCPHFSTWGNSYIDHLVRYFPDLIVFQSPDLTNDLDRREKNSNPKARSNTFRLQKDLLNIRKQLAPALLQTSRQVQSEAAGVFYSRNTWQFLYDRDWHLMFRFLNTIGPSDRTLIKNLESTHQWLRIPLEGQGLAASATTPNKNHPKLHMAKTPHCSAQRGCEKCYYDRVECCDCRDKTFELLMREETLEKIKSVVPRGYAVYDLKKTSGDLVVPDGFTTKITLDFVPGAFLSRDLSDLSAESFTGLGWNVSAGPDSEGKFGDFWIKRVLMNPINQIRIYKGRDTVTPDAA